MELNRRNALIGLGGLAIGGGALLGSGAFTSVEAERDVEVNIFGANEGDEGTVPGDVDDDEQQEIADNITDNAVDVLVDLDPASVTVRSEAGTVFENGDELFPAGDAVDIYENVDGDRYISLVANDVTIVFGGEEGLAPSSNFGYSDFFAFADPNDNSPDVGFVTGNPDPDEILTEINDEGPVTDTVTVTEVGDGQQVDATASTGSDDDGSTEDLNIGVGVDPTDPDD